MDTYILQGQTIDSVELKCLLVSRGLNVDKEVYRDVSPYYRLSKSPLHCNCMILPDGTIVQMTDVGFHLRALKGMLSWDTLKLVKYAKELTTPFSLVMKGGKPTVVCDGEIVTSVEFPSKTDFYHQRTERGLPYTGNAVLQGLDWVAFQCLWPCDFGAAGKPCQFCFSGAQFESLARRGKPQPPAVDPEDVASIVAYAVDHAGCNSIQITGGSTFNGMTESDYIRAYLKVIAERVGLEKITGDLLLYITPPADLSFIDEYFALGATRIACSLEVWDENLARVITPGKMEFTTRERHLDALDYIVERYGKGKAFSNFIIGIEPYECLEEGATYLAKRGIIPSASVWMPMGRPVMGSMKAPDLGYYRKVEELFARLYRENGLEPAGGHGLNVCVERDIWHNLVEGQ